MNETVWIELAQMVQARWKDACATMEKARGLAWESAGQFCPEKDWPKYHAGMLAVVEKELAKATELIDALIELAPTEKGEAT